MITLIICDRTARERSNETIYFSAVVTLLLKTRLHIRNYLVRRHAIVAIDGPIPCVIGVGTVTPGRKPVAGVPIIRRSEYEHEVVAVMSVPPILIVPLWFVVAKHCVFLALPVLASLDPSSLLEFYRRRLRSIWLFCKIEVLRLKRLVLREFSLRCILVGSSFVRLVPFARSVNLTSIPCLDCLSLSLDLVLLTLMSLIKSIVILFRFFLLPLIYRS